MPVKDGFSLLSPNVSARSFRSGSAWGSNPIRINQRGGQPDQSWVGARTGAG